MEVLNCQLKNSVRPIVLDHRPFCHYGIRKFTSNDELPTFKSI